MMSKTAKVGIPLVLLAVLYQIVLKDIIFVAIGVGRIIQPLSDFPYQCRRLDDPRLQACEDMWFSEKTRILFLACSDPLGKQQWMPNIAKFNVSGRSRRDAVIAMSIDKPQGESYEYKVLSIPGFSSASDDQYELHGLGITGRDHSDGTVELFLVNNKPQVDPSTGEVLLDQSTGANTTIEQFYITPSSKTLRYVRTYAHEHISTPNNIALDGESSFWITNDHGSHKTGWRNQLSPILGTADVTYCTFDHTTKATACSIVATGLGFPNGLIKGYDGLVYVPFSSPGGINVYKPEIDGSLSKVDNINIDYALDNLSQDADGTIFAAGFPKMIPALAAFNDPMNVFPPSTILKVRKTGKGYVWEKEVEDNAGEALGMSTVAISDVKTGRLFIGTAVSPFVTVCEKIK